MFDFLVLIHSQTKSKFLINTEISRTTTSVKHQASRIMVTNEDQAMLLFHVEEHSFTNNFVQNFVSTMLSAIYRLFISSSRHLILASSMPTCSRIRHGAPQFDHELVGEAKVFQVGIVYRLGEVYAVAFALGELPDLRGCDQNQI